MTPPTSRNKETSQSHNAMVPPKNRNKDTSHPVHVSSEASVIIFARSKDKFGVTIGKRKRHTSNMRRTIKLVGQENTSALQFPC